MCSTECYTICPYVEECNGACIVDLMNGGDEQQCNDGEIHHCHCKE